MKSKFQGVWATFEFLDDFCDSISQLKQNNIHSLTAHSPCPRHEIDHALHQADSRVPFFTLIFGIIGTLTGFVLATWISLDWVLPVSNKPIISIPPFVVIMFELAILFGAYGTATGILALIFKDTKKRCFPQSEKYIKYSQFTIDRFGLVVRCNNEDQYDTIKNILEINNAEEINIEK